MAKVAIKQATMSKLLRLFVQDLTSGSGAGLTGLVYNSGLIAAPSSAPTVGAATAGGSVDIGTRQFAITFLDSSGKETTPSANSATATTTSGNQTIPLSAIPTGGAGTAKRALYASKVGTTSPLYYAITLSDNSTTAYNYTMADSALGTANPPAANGTGLYCSYIMEGQATKTQVALAAGTVGTWTSGGFKEIDPVYLPGVYELGLPNAALASGNSVLVMLFGAANMVPVLSEIQLDGFDYANGLTSSRPEKVSLGTGGGGSDQLIEYEADGTTVHKTWELTTGTPGSYTQRS